MVEEQWVQWNVLFPLWFILMSLVDLLYCIYILFNTLFFMLKLYFSCRHNNKPYLLIDFSNYLRTDVWVCFSFVTGVWHWLYSPHTLVDLISMYPCFFVVLNVALFLFMNLLCSYVLGAVFLQLCQVLRLGEHPIVQKPVDPSLFIHRYTKSECFLFTAHFV